MFAGGNASAAIQAFAIINFDCILSNECADRTSFHATVTTRSATATTRAFTVFKAALIIIDLNHTYSLNIK